MKETYLDYHYAYLSPKTEWLFVTPSLDSQDLSIQVQEVGHMIYEGRHHTHRGPLESYQISYQLTDISGTMIIGDREYDYPRKGQILFLDCTTGYYMESEGYGDGFFVHFWSPAIAYYYRLFLEMNNGSPLLMESSDVVFNNLQRLCDIYRHPNTRNDDLRAELLIMEMITHMLKIVTPKNKHKYSDYVELALQVIQNDYMESINLDTLAEKVHVSKYYLSHIFKKEVGMTPANYIQLYRVNKAKELLRTTNLSQETICDRVGLYNGSYLSKLFRTYEGMTPDQYRKKWSR